MTRYGIILGKKPPPAPPVKPQDYFMGIDYGPGHIEMIVGHLEKGDSLFFSIDFLDQNIENNPGKIINWVINIQEHFKNLGILKTQADKTWFGAHDVANEMVIPTPNWKKELHEQCDFYHIPYNWPRPIDQKTFSIYEDAYDFALSLALKSSEEIGTN
jgi:hypothetical protein